jgi:hypothetical protein
LNDVPASVINNTVATSTDRQAREATTAFAADIGVANLPRDSAGKAVDPHSPILGSPAATDDTEFVMRDTEFLFDPQVGMDKGGALQV